MRTVKAFYTCDLCKQHYGRADLVYKLSEITLPNGVNQVMEDRHVCVECFPTLLTVTNMLGMGLEQQESISGLKGSIVVVI